MTRGTILFSAGVLCSLAAGWIGLPYALYERKAQPVNFSHKVHTGDKGGMKCEDCHALRDDGLFAGIPAMEKCSGCHTAPLGDTPAEKQFVKDFVTPNRSIQWAVYARQPQNVYFPHAPHVKLAKLKCEECHGPHGTTDTLRPYQEDRITGYSRDLWGRTTQRVAFKTERGMRMDDCIDCHRKNSLEHSCLDCHK